VVSSIQINDLLFVILEHTHVLGVEYQKKLYFFIYYHARRYMSRRNVNKSNKKYSVKISFIGKKIMKVGRLKVNEGTTKVK